MAIFGGEVRRRRLQPSDGIREVEMPKGTSLITSRLLDAHAVLRKQKAQESIIMPDTVAELEGLSSRILLSRQSSRALENSSKAARTGTLSYILGFTMEMDRMVAKSARISVEAAVRATAERLSKAFGVLNLHSLNSEHLWGSLSFSLPGVQGGRAVIAPMIMQEELKENQTYVIYAGPHDYKAAAELAVNIPSLHAALIRNRNDKLVGPLLMALRDRR